MTDNLGAGIVDNEEEVFIRTEMLLGVTAMERLRAARVAVFGIGGVGGYVVEALVRSGIGAIDLIDHDKVSPSNINRQIIALRSSLGRYKVDVMEERIKDINPNCVVRKYPCFYLPKDCNPENLPHKDILTKEELDFSQFTYVVDAVDTVTAKIAIVMEAKQKQVPVISSMGAGNKLNPAAFEVADLYETSVCPLAKVMRRELKKRGIMSLKVVYSREKPLSPTHQADLSGKEQQGETEGTFLNTAEKEKTVEQVPAEQTQAVTSSGKMTPGSAAFVPSAAGLIIASEVVKDIVMYRN